MLAPADQRNSLENSALEDKDDLEIDGDWEDNSKENTGDSNSNQNEVLA
eukprot:CAMPEP_0168326484 /NCGR_PEP_ID=MMETSP0213-20121227/5320_1 /TAXON_ID=151035 /ORGANISM="Euplotes harpa, Strain FSP1.4" /LENGTH=48 /DNA_ID= /DNA_START= /DNA_END= /DNA_ORIENTATION=